MRSLRFISTAVVIAALLTSSCSRSEPPPEAVRPEPARAEAAAQELQRKRTDEGARMDKRVADLDRHWTELESKIGQKSTASTAAVRAEVKEDVKNVREAVADLKTTTPENWWERHERAMERTAADIEEDVRRLARSKGDAATAPAPEPPDNASPFASRRDRFVARLAARVNTMEEQLKGVRASGAQKMELQDTHARVSKLKGDVDRLRNASADDWWDISAKRVNEYIDRLDDSISRLDDDKTKR